MPGPLSQTQHQKGPLSLLGLSGFTLVAGFTMIRFTLHSAKRDLDSLRKEGNDLVKSSVKQGLQLEQIAASLQEINKKLA